MKKTTFIFLLTGFKKLTLRGLLFLGAFIVLSCGKVPETPFSQEALSINKSFSSGAIKHFRSTQNLGSLLSKEHYKIKARLIEKDSKLELFSHSRASHLEDGIRIKIQRQNQDLIVQIGIENYPNKTLLKKIDYFKKQKEMDWTLEVENGTLYGFRVQIWENFLNRSGFIKKQTELLTPENKIADSLKSKLTFYTKGKGLKWGIKTYKTDLISAHRVPIKKL